MEQLQLSSDQDTLQIVGNEDESIVFRKPQRAFRYTQSKGLLGFYGITSIILGIGVICCGFASFAILPHFQTRQGFQIENKWTALTVLLSGLAALALMFKQCTTFVATILIFAPVSVAMALVSLAIHGANVHFRNRDTAAYSHDRDREMSSKSQKIAYVNIALCVINACIVVVSLLLHLFAQKLVSRNYGYRLIVNKHRLRLALIGLLQIVLGLLMTAWWAGLEVLFKGASLSVHTLPTGEILCHGLVITCAGSIQMVATAKGAQPTIVATAALNGAALLLTSYFSSYPISILSLMVGFSGQAGQSPEIKTLLCIFLAAIYGVEIGLSLYSFLKFIKLAAAASIPTIEHVLSIKMQRMHLLFAVMQSTIGMLYAVVEVLTVGMFFLYRLDFSSLPVLVISSALILYAGTRSMQPLVLGAAVATVVLCIPFSLRDLSLFIFHLTAKSTADAHTNQTMSGANLAMHLAQVALSVSELILAVLIMISLIKILKVAFQIASFRLLKSNASEKIRMWISIFQLAFGIAVIALGFDLFISSTNLYLEDLGDRTIMFGLLMSLTGILGAATKKFPTLIVITIFSQGLLLTLICQESDRLSYLVHNYAHKTQQQQEQMAPGAQKVDFHEHRQFGMSCVILFSLLMNFMLSAIYVLLTGTLIEEAEFTRNLQVTQYEDGQIPYEYEEQLPEEMIDIPKNMFNQED